MNFKDWYATCSRGNDDFEMNIPVVIIESPEHYKDVVQELSRLGFGCGNDFSKYATPEVPVTRVDIWYDDFYNSWLAPCEVLEGMFIFTVEELRAADARPEFLVGYIP